MIELLDSVVSNSMAMISAWLNGVPAQEISVSDRGLLYGDGFFTTASVKLGKVLLLDAHLDRIQESAKRLKINIDVNHIADDLNSFLQSNAKSIKSGNHVLKIIVTRSESGRGYFWGENNSANVLLQLFRFEGSDQLNAKRKRGIRLAICETPLSSNPVLAGIKHLSRIEQVMASGEFDRAFFDEGLMLDQSGNVVEGCMSNIFISVKGELLTPIMDQCGVEGLMKQEIVRSFISTPYQVQETRIKLDDLFKADAIFLSNTLLGFCPVRVIQGSEWQANIDSEQELLAQINLENLSF